MKYYFICKVELDVELKLYILRVDIYILGSFFMVCSYFVNMNLV